MPTGKILFPGELFPGMQSGAALTPAPNEANLIFLAVPPKTPS
ncbi:hypothetical protein HMPREF3293_02028 [Christensenella minuta]|uniref:Uncharacterized protein n=1 Tax=Christensenella minuta TaxID=626937 RepID=A0A136Q288_9FIRM|nr:hypothetical protein HMPREF3293_02028 [Christensenella minuta]